MENPDEADAPESETTATPEPKRKKRRWRKIAAWTLGLVIGIPVVAFGLAYVLLDVRSPQEVLADLDKTVVLQNADGSELLKVVPPGGDRLFVPYDAVPAKLRDAIVATEDPTFWDNEGFDLTGLGRALVTGVGGGSGITQQYIKKSTGNEDATLTRKFSELVLATKITQQQTKKEIFESYVNIISFGRGTYGPASAMNAYFGRKLDDSMTWSEAAFLAGMIQSPSVHDPYASSHEHAMKRWSYVMNKLVARGYVSQAEAVTMTYPEDAIQAPSETRAGRVTYEQYHIKQQVLAELEQVGYPLDRLRGGAMKVETTIDPRAQAEAEKAVKERLKGQPEHFRASLVAVEPGTGAIRAYNGGGWSVHDYAGTPYGTGSTFQPFILAAGLERGVNVDEPLKAPASVDFLGETFEFQDQCGETGKCTLREAMGRGAQGPFVDLAKKLGAEAVREGARAAGIPESVDGAVTLREKDGFLIGPGIAVGRYPLRPSDMAGAYATFAAGGMRATPHLVSKIRDENGEVVWERPPDKTPAFQGDEAVSRRIAGTMSQVLATGLKDRPAALKTGDFQFEETEDNAGGWAVGYTPQLATAVWVGSDEPRRMRDAAGEKLTGRTLPADMWQRFMNGVHRGQPSRWPDGSEPRPATTAPR
ncbi:transglycosylase domain-containing protein [Amycolatopsis keratiniphila]|uniref:transglycosylase domain-containing protein n=1 Tax=Amycolatopsis keratiniphila TaxID=129921 RepID=UPI00087AB2B1|nr:transglycosylase domain-containing protein [Amycolatopsis keratiniphila]OLZ58861.1 glycosyl transferase [Amycolatopsis keratiniphila subsp. nogabecina]SDU70172.1 Membrane carboxypeptidase (penicillin-binding protein) [Amycolatopsis keratiniphila]